MPVITKDDVVNAYNTYLNRNPTRAEINQHTGQTVPNVLQAAYNFFMPPQPAQGGGEEGGFEMPEFEFPSFEMSDIEKEHFALLNAQIQKQIATSDAENARVNARRAAMDAQVRAQYGIDLNTFEAQEAFRAAKTSRAQGERLDKALAGELPVDPALERQIGEDERTVRSKLLEQVGPGYETSTPGIQSLADFRQRAEELRSAARHDEIAQGIGPSAASAQFGLSMIGQETPMDTASIAQALQAGIGSRQASIQGAQARSNAMLSMAEMSQRERLAQLEFELKRQQLMMSGFGGSGSQSTSTGAVTRTGSGTGRAVGTGIGAAVPLIFGQNRNRGSDPFYT